MAARKNESEEKGVVVFEQFAIAQREPHELVEVIAKNFGGGRIRQSSLDRVRVPAQGMTTWTIPTASGDIESKTLDGVIVAWSEPRAFWSRPYSGGGTPPDCKSNDGEIGVGDPGGECHLCAFSKFGTAINRDGSPGEGQACRQVRLMAVLQKDDFVPLLLAAPPTSLASLDRYFMRLTRGGLSYYEVVTRFSLNKTRTKSGQEVSEIECSVLEQIEKSNRDRVLAYVNTFGKILETQGVDQVSSND